MYKLTWVPISKQLPPVGMSVITTDKNGVVGEQVLIQSAFDGRMLWTDAMDEYEYDFDSVLAWMPMPDPWKGENENDRT